MIEHIDLYVKATHWERAEVRGAVKCPECQAIMVMVPIAVQYNGSLFAFCPECRVYFVQKDSVLR